MICSTGLKPYVDDWATLDSYLYWLYGSFAYRYGVFRNRGVDAPFQGSSSMARYEMEIVSKKELRSLVLYSPQHIARLEAAGRFPKRIQLGQNRVGWLLVEVEEWLNERIAKRDASNNC